MQSMTSLKFLSALDLSIYSGYIPSKALGLVIERASLHKDELMENWDNTHKSIPAKKIEPLG